MTYEMVEMDILLLENFTLTGDERYIQLCCKLCKTDFTDIEWWGEVGFGKIFKEASEHSCPLKDVSPAEDTSMTSAEMQQIKDAAVATGKFQVRERLQVSRGNPYASTQEVVEFVERVKTVNPNQNVL